MPTESMLSGASLQCHRQSSESGLNGKFETKMRKEIWKKSNAELRKDKVFTKDVDRLRERNERNRVIRVTKTKQKKLLLVKKNASGNKKHEIEQKCVLATVDNSF